MASTYMNDLPTPQRKRYIGTAGTQLFAGEAVCYKIDATETSGTKSYQAREYYVEDPNDLNIYHPAGIIVTDAVVESNGEVEIEVIPSYAVGAVGVTMRTDMTVAVGDLLAPIPGSRLLRRGALFGRAWGRAITAATGTTATPATLRATLFPVIGLNELIRAQMVWQDDFRSFTTAHEGWVAIAASGTVQGPAAGSIDSLGGLLVLTPQAADNASALIHGQLVGGGFGAVLGRPFLFEALVDATVDSTSGFFCGLLDAAQTVAATLPIADAGTTVAADLLAFHKAEGTAVWSGITYGSGAAGSAGATTPFAVSTDYLLRAYYDGVGGVSWSVNGVRLGSRVTTANAIPASNTALLPVFQSKNGSGTAGVLRLKHFNGVQVK